jgi:hypothetical protein
MPEPRNQGIGSYRQEIGNLNAPDIRPVMPERTEPYDMGAAVQKIVGAIGGVVQQWGQLSEKNQNRLEEAERLDLAKDAIDFPLDSIQIQGNETASQAVERTLLAWPRYKTLQPKNQVAFFEHIANRYQQKAEQGQKQWLYQEGWRAKSNMTVMLLDPAQRADGLALYEGQVGEWLKAGLTEEMTREPLQAALQAYAARGDIEGINAIAPMANFMGMGDEVDSRLAHAEIAKEQIAARDQQLRQKIITGQVNDFSNGLADQQNDAYQRDLSDQELHDVAQQQRQAVFQSSFDGTQNQKWLEQIDRFELRQGQRDFKALNDLSERIGRVLGGVSEPMLETDLAAAWNAGSFGPGKSGSTLYQQYVSRLKTGKESARWEAVKPMLSVFRADVGGRHPDMDSEMLVFLYQKALRGEIADHPDWTDVDAVQAAAELATRWSNMPTSEVQQRMKDLGGGATANPTANRTPPVNHPDAAWDERRQMWTVWRDGKLMGIKP